MHRFVLSTFVAAVCAALAPVAHARLVVSIDSASAAPGATVTIPVRITSDNGTSLVNSYAAAIVADSGTFGASTVTSGVSNLPQFLGTSNFFDSGDVGDPPVGREASAINNLSDAAAGESIDVGQSKGLFLATFTVPATARQGDRINLSLDLTFTSFSSPMDTSGNTTQLSYDTRGAVVLVTPEPATLGLLGLAGLVGLRRRRSSRA